MFEGVEEFALRQIDLAAPKHEYQRFIQIHIVLQ